MTYREDSIPLFIRKSLENKKFLRLNRESDEEQIHQILESVGMNLGKAMNLYYSRRPALSSSYLESYDSTYLYIDGPKTTMTSAVSETSCLIKGIHQKQIYTSDLRMGRQTTQEVRNEFNETYRDLIKLMPDDTICTTAILKENTRALKKLTGSKNSVSYNHMFDYATRTILVGPRFFSRRQGLKNFRIFLVSNENKRDTDQFRTTFLNDKAFSHLPKTREAEEHFCIKDDQGIIHGHFSVYRPTNRKILVQIKQTKLRFLLKSLGLNLDKIGMASLNWVYLTSMALDPSLEANKNIIPAIIDFLKSQKLVKAGELLLILHPDKKDPSYTHKLFSTILNLNLQFSKISSLFRVESSPADRTTGNDVFLDPLQL